MRGHGARVWLCSQEPARRANHAENGLVRTHLELARPAAEGAVQGYRLTEGCGLPTPRISPAGHRTSPF
eukprot:scaffold2477_cov95-Isochrysis_galbana.AAC.6